MDKQSLSYQLNIASNAYTEKMTEEERQKAALIIKTNEQEQDRLELDYKHHKEARIIEREVKLTAHHKKQLDAPRPLSVAAKPIPTRNEIRDIAKQQIEQEHKARIDWTQKNFESAFSNHIETSMARVHNQSGREDHHEQ